MRLPDSQLLAARHRRVRAGLAGLGVDGLVVTNPSNVRYLTNHAGSAGALVLTGERLWLLLDSRYMAVAEERQASVHACPGLALRPVPASYDDAILDALASLPGATSIGVEGTHLTLARYEWLVRGLGSRGLSVTLRSTDRVVEGVRSVKDAFEVAALADAAARLTDVAHAAFASIRVGVSERDVAGVIESALRIAGFERPSFDTIVASGPNSAFPHHHSGARTLESGDLVVLDFGGVLDGYCSDLTRTVSVGTPTPDALRLHSAVRRAQQAALDAVKPGVTAPEVDAAARAVFEPLGLADRFGHGTGHGLGLDIHELPRVGRPRSGEAPERLEPGMVITIEPGLYVPGTGGVRIEDDVLVTETGARVLTAVSRDLVPLPA